jgi:hypothetical protein
LTVEHRGFEAVRKTIRGIVFRTVTEESPVLHASFLRKPHFLQSPPTQKALPPLKISYLYVIITYVNHQRVAQGFFARHGRKKS